MEERHRVWTKVLPKSQTAAEGLNAYLLFTR